jgi:hemerythrin
MRDPDGRSSSFVWKREYDLGIAEIDDQHKMIMEKFNALSEAISEGSGQPRIAALIVELIDYAQKHFHDEEELFAKTGYPREKEQRIAHRDFGAKAETFYQSYLRNSTINAVEVLGFLQDWIKNHLLTLDMDYKEFMMKLEALERLKRL